MRPPPSKGLGTVVLVHTQVRLLSSYLNKRTKVQFKRIKHSRCGNTAKTEPRFICAPAFWKTAVIVSKAEHTRECFPYRDVIQWRVFSYQILSDHSCKHEKPFHGVTRCVDASRMMMLLAG